MRVLFVSAEFYPLAKTGGLADVSAALPAALRDLGIDVRVLLPGYSRALELAPSPREVVQLGDPLGRGETRLLKTVLPNSNVPVWLVDCPNLYNRTGGLYQDGDGRDWPDNDLRFALLNHVAAGIANEPGEGWQPNVIHANDWHASLVPLLVSAQKRQGPATILTIHNLAYQGIFEPERFPQLGLPAEAFSDMEFYGRISFLNAGIRSADAITTVSPTYAREILTAEYGCGLDGLLREKASRLTGILNGVNYDIWDPSIDPYLARNFGLYEPTRSPEDAGHRAGGAAYAHQRRRSICIGRGRGKRLPRIVPAACDELSRPRGCRDRLPGVAGASFARRR
jgi:starch synthase